MNNLGVEQKRNLSLYRELFFKGNEEILKQINILKSYIQCENCKICCKIRYTDLSPEEIFNLHENGDDVISSEYMELFLPYGANSDFDYENNSTICIKINNEEAKKVNENYVKKILEKSSTPVYFYHCKDIQNCSKEKRIICNNFPSSISTILPDECAYIEWQKKSLEKLQNEISRDILIKLQEIQFYRHNSFECKKTGTCCRMASSEFSYEELKEKAKNGDNFATQFTSIFIPYENLDKVKEIFPEFVEYVFSTLGENEKVYFYHCPHIAENNLCSIYEKRPEICREFPSNPLSIIPSCCGFYEWKEEIHVSALFLHALVEICDFYIKKIEFTL